MADWLGLPLLQSRLSWQRALSGLACGVILGATRAALAEPPSTPVAERVAAQALFEQGRALVADGRAVEACPKFEESQRIDAGLGTQFNLADCYERIGKFASAYELFTEVATVAGSAGQAERQRVADTRARAVARKASKLTITVAHAELNVHIERDGRDVGPAQWGVAIPVDPGVHRVRAWGPGLAEWHTELQVTAEPGSHSVTILPVRVLEEHPSRSFFESSEHKLGLVAAGVGVLALGGGGYFALRALSKDDASDRDCQGSLCSTPSGLELRKQARHFGTLASVATGIGVAGLGTAATLFWVIGTPDPQQPAAGTELYTIGGPSGGAIVLGRRF